MGASTTPARVSRSIRPAACSSGRAKCRRVVSLRALPCRNDVDVWRYPNGRLSNVVLAGPAVIDDVTYAANTEIDLDEQGHVVSAVMVHREEGVRYKRRVHGRIVPG
jgi:hypothetical protein